MARAPESRCANVRPPAPRPLTEDEEEGGAPPRNSGLFRLHGNQLYGNGKPGDETGFATPMDGGFATPPDGDGDELGALPPRQQRPPTDLQRVSERLLRAAAEIPGSAESQRVESQRVESQRQ